MNTVQVSRRRIKSGSSTTWARSNNVHVTTIININTAGMRHAQDKCLEGRTIPMFDAPTTASFTCIQQHNMPCYGMIEQVLTDQGVSC
jgi:peroxiredoxin